MCCSLAFMVQRGWPMLPVRGDGMAGLCFLWLLGNVLLYCAYAAVALLLVGLTRNMATALSGWGCLRARPGFCGRPFPIDGAPLLARCGIGSPFSSRLCKTRCRHALHGRTCKPHALVFGRTAAVYPDSFGRALALPPSRQHTQCLGQR